MSSNSTFDVLMEIRQVDKQTFEEKLKLQKSQQELMKFEKSINDVKALHLKASSFLLISQREFEDTNIELENFHKKYKTLIEDLEQDREFPNNIKTIDELKHKRDICKDQLMRFKAKKEDLAMKLNEIEIQISIEKV